MALGGGAFTAQNKRLPGAYLNFYQCGKGNDRLSDRGIAAMPFVGDWGKEDEVFSVTAEQFQENSRKPFRYDATHPQMTMFRESVSERHQALSVPPEQRNRQSSELLRHRKIRRQSGKRTDNHHSRERGFGAGV